MAENTPEQWYKNLPILTRIGVTTFFGATVLVMMDILNPNLIFLNWLLVINKLQVWRLLTSVVFFGKFSFQFIFQLYFWCSFSSKLEQNEIFRQPGDYLFFLLVQILLIDALSLVLAWPTGLPMLGPSLIFAVIYYWSRREPYASLSFFSFSIKGYQFPFCLLLFQLLIGGSIWGDMVGLASGHIFYFLAEVVPQEYGRRLIKTPSFLIRMMTRFAAPGRPAAPAAGGGVVPNIAPPPPPTNFGGAGHRLGGN